MLNYAYAILEHQVKMQILAAGLEPTIGFLHGAYRDKATLVYDLMEPLRPIVDRKILEFIRENIFKPADFTLSHEGVCRLNPQLARNIVRLVDVEIEARETVQALKRLL
jgi:CRISPR-associated endonuclease Cas1